MKKYLIISIFAIISSLILPSEVKAYVDKSSCYTYDSTSAEVGKTTPIILNNGSTLNITNTYPSSILQKFNFINTNNSNGSCALTDIDYGSDSYAPYVWSNFISNSGSFINFPFASSYTEPLSNTTTIGGIYGEWRTATVPQPYGNFEHPEFEDLTLFLKNLLYDGSINLAPPTSSVSEYTNYYTNEDTLLTDISITKSIKLHTESSAQSNGFNVTAPATNCVSLGGTGQIKIVFMRVLGSKNTTNDYLEEINGTLTKLKEIDPFKTYWNKFSFYVDLKKVYDPSTIYYTGGGESGLIDFVTSGGQYNVDTKTNAFTSSCKTSNSEIDVVFFKEASFFPAWTSQYGKTIFINDVTGKASAGEMALMLARQLGKSIGGLNATNIISSTGELTNPVNCSTHPATDYRGADGYMYGSTKSEGCYYNKTGIMPWSDKYYRPSTESIMSQTIDSIPKLPNATDASRFDVISCGYIVAGLMGESPTKANASKYWPTCLNSLDSAGKKEISARTNPPTLSSITPSGSNNTFVLSGSGITSSNNIKLIPVTVASVKTNNQKANSKGSFDSIKKFFKNIFGAEEVKSATTNPYYEIVNVTSSTNSSLTLTVPSYIPNGKYKLSISGENSNWNDTNLTIDVTGNTETSDSGLVDENQTTTVPPTTSTSNSSIVYSCTSGYTLQSVSSCYKTPTAATLGYACNAGDTFGYDVYTHAPTCLNSTLGAYTPTQAYQCPSGSTLSGTSCTWPTINATPSCNTGYKLNSGKTACDEINYATNVKATAGTGTNSNSITITWTNVYAYTPSEIQIQRSSDANFGFSTIATLSSSATSYTDTGLPELATRYYKVIPIINGVNNNTNVTVASAKTIASYPSPVSISSMSANASFGYVNSLVYIPTTGFASVPYISLERSNNASTGFTEVATSPVTVSAKYMLVKDSSTNHSTSYYYRARFIYPDGTKSNYVNSVMVTTPTPTKPVIKITANGTVGANLTWTDSNTDVQSFKVFSSTTQSIISSVPANVKAYTVSGLTLGKSYCYSIQTVFGKNSSISGAPVCITLKDSKNAITATSMNVSSYGACPIGYDLSLKVDTKNQTVSSAKCTKSKNATQYVIFNPPAKTVAYTLSTTISRNQIKTCAYPFKLNSDESACTNFINFESVSPASVVPKALKMPVESATDSNTTDQTNSTTPTTNITTPSPVVNTANINTDTSKISATIGYTCSGSGILQGTTCAIKSFIGDGNSADKDTTCLTGYTKVNSTTCKNKTTLATTSTTIIYKCGDRRTLNTADNKCYLTATSTVPAAVIYSCPQGYTIDQNTHTCLAKTSMRTKNSTSTASVWSIVKELIVNIFD